MRIRSGIAAVAVTLALVSCGGNTPEEPAPPYTVSERTDSDAYVDIEVTIDVRRRLRDVFDQVLADNPGEGGYFITMKCGADGPNHGQALAFGRMAEDAAGASATGLLSEGMYRFDPVRGASCP